jgi:hypothetical protein
MCTPEKLQNYSQTLKLDEKRMIERMKRQIFNNSTEMTERAFLKAMTSNSRLLSASGIRAFFSAEQAAQ